jgi:hypothetical protein
MLRGGQSGFGAAQWDFGRFNLIGDSTMSDRNKIERKHSIPSEQRMAYATPTVSMLYVAKTEGAAGGTNDGNISASTSNPG